MLHENGNCTWFYIEKIMAYAVPISIIGFVVITLIAAVLIYNLKRELAYIQAGYTQESLAGMPSPVWVKK